MNTRNNLKSKRTVKIIQEALLTILADGKKIEEISIKELCETADINRSTFYSHYSIIDDVLHELEDDTLKKTSEYIALISKNEIDQVTSLFTYIKENKKVFKILFLQGKDPDFSDKLLHNSFLLFNKSRVYQKDKVLYDFIQSYGTEGSKALLMQWAENDFEQKPEQLAKLCIYLNKVVIDSAFKINSIKE